MSSQTPEPLQISQVAEIVRPPSSPPFWKKTSFPSRDWSEAKDAQGRSYYVDHKNRITTWIDPRDHPDHPRRPNDLPYGWDYAEDPDIGIYFIDHLTKRNTLDDPRLTAEYKLRQEQFQKLLADEKARLEERKRLLAAQQEQVALAEIMLQQEMQRKETLEKAVQTRDMNDVGTDTAEFDELRTRIEGGQKALQAVKEDHALMAASVAESEKTLHDLSALDASMKESQDDELEIARKVQQEINDSRAEYEKDRSERLQLEDAVRNLTSSGNDALKDILDEPNNLAPGDGLEGSNASKSAGLGMTGKSTRPALIQDPLQANQIFGDNGEILQPRVSGESRNRLELGLELMTLRKMIGEQRKEIHELRSIKGMLESEDGATKLAQIAASMEEEEAALMSADADGGLLASAPLVASSLSGANGALLASTDKGYLSANDAGGMSLLESSKGGFVGSTHSVDIGSAPDDGMRYGDHNADFLGKKRARDAAAAAAAATNGGAHGANGDKNGEDDDGDDDDDDDEDGVYVSIEGGSGDIPAAARRKKVTMSEDTADNEKDDEFYEKMKALKGRDWRQTLRRVYKKQEIFPSHPEALSFDAKLSYFKKLMVATKSTSNTPEVHSNAANATNATSK